MLCRLCLIDFNENGTPLLSDDNGNTEILAIIMKFMEIELKSNDAISALICQKCWQHLHDFYEFCQYIENQQYNLYSKRCAIVKNEPGAEIALDVDGRAKTAVGGGAVDTTHSFDNNEESLLDIKDILIDGVESILTEGQEEEFNSANLADEDAADVESANQDDIPLKQLFKTRLNMRSTKKRQSTTSTKKKVQNHRTKSKTSASKTVQDKTKRKAIKTNKAAKIVPVEEEAASSAEVVNDEELRKCEEFLNSNMLLKCEICEAKFETFHLLRTHYSTEHNCRGYMKCCGKVIKTRTRLVDHIKYHLNPKQYECEMCKTYFRSKYNLSSHMLKVHPKTEQLRYKCPLCDKGFALNSDYERHVAQHQTERNSICEICQKGFTNKYSLSVHIKTIHKNPSFICNHCGKEYKDKACFQDHIAKHEGTVAQATVQCSECKSWLKNKATLRIHMGKHFPIEIECKLCNRICHTKQTYVAHMRYAHSELPNLVCKFCDKTFKRKENLQEHMAMHTGEKNNVCSHCSKEFRSKANMYAHIKKDHVVEWMQSKLQRSKNLEKHANITTTTTIT